MVTLYRKENPLAGVGDLPPATLFTGPRWSGKMTTALECARELFCLSKESGCTCKQCISSETLGSPDLLILGNRDFMAHIHGTGDAFIKDPSTDHYVGFVRAVKTLLSRWSPFLYDSSEGKYKKPLGIAIEIGELLFNQETTHTVPQGKKVETFVRGIIKKADQLCKEMKQRSLTIGMIRNMDSWIREAPQGEYKVVILEGIDEVSPAVANGLLKIIEEPPSYLRFFLLGTNRSGVIATILSRVRHITIPPYRKREQELILKEVFVQESEVESLQDFALILGGIDTVSLHGLADVYLKTLYSTQLWGIEEMNSLIDHVHNEEAFSAYIHILQKGILESIPEHITPEQGKMAYDIIRSAKHRAGALRLSLPLVLESLCLDLRSIL